MDVVVMLACCYGVMGFFRSMDSVLNNLKFNGHPAKMPDGYAVFHGRLPFWRFLQNPDGFSGKLWTGFRFSYDFKIAQRAIQCYNKLQQHLTVNTCRFTPGWVFEVFGNEFIELFHASSWLCLNYTGIGWNRFLTVLPTYQSWH